MWSRLRENAEVAVLALLLVLLITCVDPFEAIMPASWEHVLIVCLIALFSLYAGLLFRRPTKDEREMFHLIWAERSGFIVGTSNSHFGA